METSADGQRVDPGDVVDLAPDSELGVVFEPDGDRWVPQPIARGPWADDALHGGPPAALLGRAITRHEPGDDPHFLARITFEIMRPVPTRPLSVKVNTVRPGRRVQVVDALLLDGDTEVMSARALRLQRTSLDLGPDDVPVPAWTPPPAPAECRSKFRLQGAWQTFGDAMEIRLVHGQPFLELGPALCWFRLRVPMFAGEENTPLTRVLAAADFPNGISNVVPHDRFVYINPDLTVSLHRLPVGEWVAVDAVTRLGDGHGTATAALADQDGPLGTAIQSLLVFPR